MKSLFYGAIEAHALVHYILGDVCVISWSTDVCI